MPFFNFTCYLKVQGKYSLCQPGEVHMLNGISLNSWQFAACLILLYLLFKNKGGKYHMSLPNSTHWGLSVNLSFNVQVLLCRKPSNLGYATAEDRATVQNQGYQDPMPNALENSQEATVSGHAHCPQKTLQKLDPPRFLKIRVALTFFSP